MTHTLSFIWGQSLIDTDLLEFASEALKTAKVKLINDINCISQKAANNGPLDTFASVCCTALAQLTGMVLTLLGE